MSPRGPEDRYVEAPSMELLATMGWQTVDAFEETFGSGGTLGRDSRSEVVLTHRLRTALRSLNSENVPDSVINEALELVAKDRSLMDPTRANQEVYKLLRDGHPTEWTDDEGNKQYETIRYLDYTDPSANDLLAVQQMWIKGAMYTRRPDVVLFVNGLPLVLAEFKEPSESVRSGFDDNVTDYRDTIPALFTPNLFVLVSNGSEAKLGSTFAPWKFFADWKFDDSQGQSRPLISIEKALLGACNPATLLDLLENFVAYMERPGGLIKIISKSHQYYGVNDALVNFERARREGDKRLGVFWHTQGSGKSLSMLWFTQKVLRRIPGNWTFVMVTDRKELDEQLHGEFAAAGAVPAEAKVHASSGANLRKLLAADNRYVFTLIHKFQPVKAQGETQMPVLSDRSDIIVITDEAHRSQYDTLALNMRTALPNASMMGFTGTPLIKGEEEATREQFGDYVSVYNFRDAIEDGATVPLYYENRIPELQLTNENFSQELEEILEDAEIDEDAESQLAREFATTYKLLTRPERLRKIAKDLVAHFVGRGFSGKAMYVGLDKAAAVRMYDLVKEEWAEHLKDLQVERDALPVLERDWVNSRIEFMESTDMAVVVSQSQNELKTLDEQGLDIRPHRERFNAEDLATKFKDPDDPLRLVFVCAMWMTGFDAPSVSTVYLDRPMKNHTLMQTIARANRVFPDKENGLIVDYIGVFRNLERALAVYGAASGNEDSPIEIIDELAEALNLAVSELLSFSAAKGVDLVELCEATGFDHIALRDAAVEALLVDEPTRVEFQEQANYVRKIFKALLPNPAAREQQATVAAIREVSKRIAEVTSPDPLDLTAVSDAVDELLDRSVGAEEYIIRAVTDGSEQDPLIDLSNIDFEGLSARFAGRKRAETDRLAQILRKQSLGAAHRNPTRFELVERIEQLIADYNAGSLNIDEYLRRLVDLSHTLTAEEERAVREGLSEEELAIFDLLTQPEPELTESEIAEVKRGIKPLLDKVHESLALDWRLKADAKDAMNSVIRRALDENLPEAPYTPEVFLTKAESVFAHVLASYISENENVYTARLQVERPKIDVVIDSEDQVDIDKVTVADIERIKSDPEFAKHVARQLEVDSG